MNVLHVAYGFLEWSDGFQTDTSVRAVNSLRIANRKAAQPEGVEFQISGTGDDPTINAVLAEKLRLDFGVELPAFIGSSVEEYFFGALRS